MLFRNPVLEAIREGHVDLAFRRWSRARVLPGSRLRTRAGVLAVESVEVVDPADIGEDDARRAGFGSAGELLASLEPGREGTSTRSCCATPAPTHASICAGARS